MSSESSLHDLRPIVALCKRRGFIFPGSDLYGGFANTYSYGPYGVTLKRRVRELWWRTFIDQREDMVGLDGPILLHPQVWEASGHTAGFSDALVDCKACKARLRADHLIEQALSKNVEGLSVDLMSELLREGKVPCPKCGVHDWTHVRHFNLMFRTELSKTGGAEFAYLRPETAQAIFVDFRQLLDTMRVQVPFGVGQIGKAFRNEITPGNFIFRTIEFEQMEIEYFVHPRAWEATFEQWLADMLQWCHLIGLRRESLLLQEHTADKLSHYSKRTVDIAYRFPFGTSELYGLAYRTDFDLRQHAEHSKQHMTVIDPESGERYTPHCIEPSFGLDRTILALLCDAYVEEELPNGERRTVLKLHPRVAPVQAAVLPLMRKEELQAPAHALYQQLKQEHAVQWDTSGAIGKRYRRQDEIGTPVCITIDYQTLEDQTVTWRDRDSMEQRRVPMTAVSQELYALTRLPSS